MEVAIVHDFSSSFVLFVQTYRILLGDLFPFFFLSFTEEREKDQSRNEGETLREKTSHY